VIFTADHGHLLGEHGYWAKGYMFDYNKLANIPLAIHLPGSDSVGGKRITALTSAIDIMPTIMELHKNDLPPHVQGKSLLRLIDDGDDGGDDKKCGGESGRGNNNHDFGNGEKIETVTSHHDAVLFGYFGKDVNMTDGRYTYCRQPKPGSILYRHTAMPTKRGGFENGGPEGRRKLAAAETGVFLDTAYGIPHYRLKADSSRHINSEDFNPIYDIAADPEQENPIIDADLEDELWGKMKELLTRYGAPACQLERLE